MKHSTSSDSNTNYLVVGDGRLARHFCYYFQLLSIPYIQCKRENLNEFGSLSSSLGDSGVNGRILLLINDDQIRPFIDEHRQKAPSDTIWIHCSGLLSLDEVENAHPLASFSRMLFHDEFYKSIPFVTVKGKMGFHELFPQLPNPSFEIDKDQKELYHARCSIAGNFTTILWQHFFQYLQKDLQLPKQMAYPFVQSIVENLLHSDDPLTGPLKRGDAKTIKRHLDKLKHSPLEDVYRSFINLYKRSEI